MKKLTPEEILAEQQYEAWPDIVAEQMRIFKEEILPEIGFDPRSFGNDAAYVAWIVALNCDKRMTALVRGCPSRKSTKIDNDFQSARAAEKEVKKILELAELYYKERTAKKPGHKTKRTKNRKTKGIKNPMTRARDGSGIDPRAFTYLKKTHLTIWEWLFADEENIQKLEGYMKKYRGKDNVANVEIIELMITPLPDGFEL
jgi:hypothetical protein